MKKIITGINKKKLQEYLRTGIIVMFCLILAGGALVPYIFSEKEKSDRENRELAKRPHFTGEKFLKGTFQSDYESYLGDQFLFRSQWVNLSTKIQAAYGKREIEGVYIGKDGYLIEKVNPEKYDNQRIDENTGYLASFLSDVSKKYGKEHVCCAIIPMKAEVMTKKLPAFAPSKQLSFLTDAIRREAGTSCHIADFRQILKEHQDEYIFYRTDHHWTTLGAFYAYREWAEQMNMRANGLTDYEREVVYRDFLGTTYNKILWKVKPDEVELFHAKDETAIHVNIDDEVVSDTFYFPEAAERGFNRYNIFLSKNTFRIVIDTSAGTGRTLLLVKDSFANCFVPFLSRHFDRIIMIDYRYGKKPMGEILEQNKDITDVLVLYSNDMFMQNTNLSKLAQTELEEQTLEEFDLEEFFR